MPVPWTIREKWYVNYLHVTVHFTHKDIINIIKRIRTIQSIQINTIQVHSIILFTGSKQKQLGGVDFSVQRPITPGPTPTETSAIMVSWAFIKFHNTLKKYCFLLFVVRNVTHYVTFWDLFHICDTRLVLNWKFNIIVQWVGVI